MSKSPLEVLREQEQARVDARLALLPELDVAAMSLADAEEQVLEERRAYGVVWKKLTGGKSPKWSAEELSAAGYDKPVSVPSRGSGSRSKKQGKQEPAEEFVVVPDGQEDGLPG